MKFLFMASVCLLIYAQQGLRGDDTRAETSLRSFLSRTSADILTIEKAETSGKSYGCSRYETLFLQDSFLNDQVFYDYCQTLNGPWEFTYSGAPKEVPDPYMPEFFGPMLRGMAGVGSRFFRIRDRIYTRGRSSPFDINKNEFTGFRRPIFSHPLWKYVEMEFSTRKRNIFFSGETPLVFYTQPTRHASYDRGVAEGKFVPLTITEVARINKLKKVSNRDSMPFFAKFPPVSGDRPFWRKDEISNPLLEKLLAQSSDPMGDPNAPYTGRFPLILIDPDHHAERVDKDDWRIYGYLNENTGGFYQYFFFEKELEYKAPLFVRDRALDHLGGVHLCKKSTVAVMLKPKDKTVKQNSAKQFDTTQIIMALDNNKQWRPAPVPEDKTKITGARFFYSGLPGQIFGSYAKIWELDIWQRLGIQLKRNPEAEVYLCGYGTLLQAAETKTVEEEHALIKKCGVLITPTMYQIFDRMGKLQKK